MIIYKIDDFWTDEDRQELQRICEEHNELQQKIREFHNNTNEAKTENLKGLERIEELITKNEEARENVHIKVKQRYIDSYGNNPEAVYDTITEILTAYTKEDFITLQRKKAENYNVFKPEKEEIQKLLKDAVKENFANCYEHLYFILNTEFSVLEFYGLPSERGQALIEAKARSFYPKRTRRKKIDLAELEKEARLFNTIRQGNTTNTLAKFRGRDMTVDEITHEATFKKGEYILKIPNYTSLSGLKTSTQQLLDIINIELTESGAKSPTVCLSLTEYMTRRGLRDRKEARNQVKNDLELLQQASIRAERRSKGNTISYEFINVADSGKIDNGNITFTFGTSFYKMLLSYPVMPYPTPLLKINGRTNPNSTPFGRKIAEHKNMNIGKTNENIISVKTLLDVSNLPTYEEVMQKGNRNVTQKIITPFERDLDKLSDIFKWNYCHSKNEPLTDAELKNLTYDIFKDLLIYVDWNEYPDTTKREEAKRQRVEQAKKTDLKVKKKKY